jgi:Clustered mitochondria
VSQPSDGKKSLVYGSADAGRTVHASDPTFNELMDRAGGRLNLAKHTVGDKQLSGPGDIEGHLGRDGRRYILDFARLNILTDLFSLIYSH